MSSCFCTGACKATGRCPLVPFPSTAEPRAFPPPLPPVGTCESCRPKAAMTQAFKIAYLALVVSAITDRAWCENE